VAVVGGKMPQGISQGRAVAFYFLLHQFDHFLFPPLFWQKKKKRFSHPAEAFFAG
jgi:hypothetical protein